MNRKDLVRLIREKKSFLCVGLDTDINLIPKHLQQTEDPIFEFNKQIIDATLAYTVAYKLNTAFYESQGIEGWISFKKTVEYLPDNVFVIADAKRGDVGNTAEHYAKAFFEYYKCDAVTVSPYMGEDSILPFFKFKNKWAILLGLTSNKGASDFQLQRTYSEQRVFEVVLESASNWGTVDNMMFVVGATRPDQIRRIREIIPNHFFLVPGVGAQGGDFDQTVKFGINSDYGLLINSSRGIIFADNSRDFATSAAREAKKLQVQMAKYI